MAMDGKFLKAIGLGMLIAAVSGCSATRTMFDDTSGSSDSNGDIKNSNGVSTFGVAVGNKLSSVGIGLDKSGSTPGNQQGEEKISEADLTSIFYFNFNESFIKPDDMSALRLHAKFLHQNPDKHLVIKGHADERGTREYNMALGERRAIAVEQVVRTMGVMTDQYETVSYGEEMPAVVGHDAASWKQNRRVEMHYLR